jgi:SAM-dependent methyltransferase
VSPSFEEHAHEWLAWSRTPGFDAYWYYRDAFFSLLPPPRGPVLEIGCGEGRVTRDLTARGYAMTAVDASATLVKAAAEADPAGHYLVADARALPFVRDSYALVVAYNSLMDVDDMPRAVAEAARVLEPGGTLAACVTHPIPDAGGLEDGRLTITRPYRTSEAFSVRDERDGLAMTFTGHRYSFEHYSRAFEAAGLAIDAIREPGPSADAPEHYAPWRDVPMFLHLRASARAPTAPPASGR